MQFQPGDVVIVASTGEQATVVRVHGTTHDGEATYEVQTARGGGVARESSLTLASQAQPPT